MRKMAVGAPVAKDDKTAVYHVSDSEDEEDLQDDRCGDGCAARECNSSKPCKADTSLVLMNPNCRSVGPSLGKPREVLDAICSKLKDNAVFKGISDALLQEVGA
jgi:hypothetical protein